jgi:hypothetical protein
MCFVCNEKKANRHIAKTKHTHKNESQKKRERENQSIVITKQRMLLRKS